MRYEGMKKFYEVDENNDSDKKVKEEFLEKEIEKLKSMNSYNYFAKKSSVFCRDDGFYDRIDASLPENI